MAQQRASSGLDVYDIAYLAGGLPRVVDTALVALVQSGRVRVHSPGELATVGLTRRHPVEAAVLDAVGPAGHRSVATICWRVGTDERILAIPRRLRGEGLLGRLAPVPAPRHSERRLVPTYAGRRLLRELRAAPPADAVAGGTDATAVALGGTQALPDRALRTAIFEPPPARTAAGGRARLPAELDYADGWQAARRTRSGIAADANRIGMGFGGPGG